MILFPKYFDWTLKKGQINDNPKITKATSTL